MSVCKTGRDRNGVCAFVYVHMCVIPQPSVGGASSAGDLQGKGGGTAEVRVGGVHHILSLRTHSTPSVAVTPP